MPRRFTPILKGVREEVQDGMYTLVSGTAGLALQVERLVLPGWKLKPSHIKLSTCLSTATMSLPRQIESRAPLFHAAGPCALFLGSHFLN